MNQMNSISADVIGGSFLNDAELALPERPRVPPEILMIPYGAHGLLFEGGDGNQIISGRGARSFIPRLVAVLDGTRTLPEILAAFPRVDDAKVFGALALLYSRGLLEDGPGAAVPEALEETAQFLGRYIDATRVNGNRGAALDRLAGTRVALAGRGAAWLAEALDGAGLAALDTPATPADLGPDTGLLLTLFSGPEPDAQDWLDAAWNAGIRILHAHIGAETAEIGPLFVPAASASPTCFRRLRPETPSGTPVDPGFWAGTVAMSAQSLVSRIGRVELFDLCHVHQGTAYERLQLARLPGSEAAGLGHVAPPETDPHNVVWRLHNAANAMPPRELLVPRDHQMHYSASNISTAQEKPDPHHGATPIALPEDRPLTDGARDGRLDLPTLGTMLRHAAGYDADGTRIAPSAGGLGSANLYLVARDVPGLPRGAMCHYYAPAHRLDYLGTVTDEELSGALGASAEDLPAALLVGASDTDKTQKKYNNFAFRFAQLDCGVARAYLTDLAGHYGLPVRDYPGLRDRSMALLLKLGIRADQEIVAFAAGLGVTAHTARRPLPALRPFQAVTQLIELSAQDGPVSAPAAIVPPAPVWSAADDPGRVLRTRRSRRVFDGVPLGSAEIGLLFREAQAIGDILEATGARRLSLEFWGIAARTDGTADILRPGPDAPQVFRPGVEFERLADLTIQPKLMEAPFVLLVTGDLHDAVARAGARGYRDLVGRAGAIAGRTLTAAWAAGIAGCPWGGMCESGWGPLLDIDRYTDCPLFGISFGRTGEDTHG
ncbi:hypothetical protein OCH239_15150 [Roseivivax halodurans JCM 10272]|uniref:Nitroreductase domain-containing protein n=1 Tax=Roseivivax halodurans JCM 10272 TaxID=1449350 RepID=X7ECW9_9RHOB|nr:nitroreductase family protein [Roseivivax halodurans]ETX12953.1 hypothetical protein OCH239_15150 [Roseivivax halodurans JCM 10272]